MTQLVPRFGVAPVTVQTRVRLVVELAFKVPRVDRIRRTPPIINVSTPVPGDILSYRRGRVISSIVAQVLIPFGG